MPQTKPKPQPAAAPAEPKPEPPQLNPRLTRIEEAQQQLEVLQKFAREINQMDSINFMLVKTFCLILSRSRGCTTPIEQFIEHLVWSYARSNDKGRGLTIEEVEQEVKDLRGSDLADEIRQAHFMASRYPLPEPKADAE